MASFSVAGRVHVEGRHATLQLELPGPNPEPEVKMCRPTTDDIMKKIDDGAIILHPSRRPIDRKRITNALGNVQRMLLLPGGAGGDWTPEAQTRLEALLAKPLIVKLPVPQNNVSAAPALQDREPLAIQDKAPADSSSSSDSSSYSSDSDEDQGEQSAMDVAEVDVASSSVSSLESRLNAANSALNAREAELSQTKADLIQAKAEFESIFSALHACQRDLRDAEAKVLEQESVIDILRHQLEQLQGETDEDELMTGD